MTRPEALAPLLEALLLAYFCDDDEETVGNMKDRVSHTFIDDVYASRILGEERIPQMDADISVPNVTGGGGFKIL